MEREVEGFGLPHNLGVLICTRVFNGGDILIVSRDQDGDWQFLCDADHSVKGACPPKLVCLEEVVKRDPTLLPLGNLRCNERARRDSKKDPWVRHDDYEDIIRDHIERFGWHVVLIPSDGEGPGFAYTIGLFKTFRSPEMIVFGLPQEVMHAVVNHAGEEFKAGRSVELNKPLDGYLQGYPIVFKEVKKKHYREYFGYARWYYAGELFSAVQCVWPDKAAHFPWDHGFDPDCLKFQPLLE